MIKLVVAILAIILAAAFLGYVLWVAVRDVVSAFIMRDKEHE